MPYVWQPSEADIRSSNLHALMQERGLSSYEELWKWSVSSRKEFWSAMVARLDIHFLKKPGKADLRDPEHPVWFPGARLNIVESCFQAPEDAMAVRWRAEGESPMREMSYRALSGLTDQVAQGISSAYKPGDALAIVMPLSPESIALYLGIIKAGCAAVGIADSFSSKEIARRVAISGAKAVFTIERYRYGGRELSPYERVRAAAHGKAVVLGKAQAGDTAWEDFLGPEKPFRAVSRDAEDTTTVLFSSGTTGDPKAIPWTHSTPMKCASDAHLHHDIHPGGRLCWPTSLGWMMGPWLIYASLINRAGICLYQGSPTSREFCEFVQDANVTMLGVVPTLVKAWRASRAAEGLDWSSIRAFSSTGECSNAEDMEWLMQRAGGRPVIEYCGGTELGGGYVTSTVVQQNYPSQFSTPALGLDFALLDGDREADSGEVFLIPPSVGLSQRLLNKDHHEVYYAGCPSPDGKVLRRHGDAARRLPNGYYQLLGRIDDTMKLSGIKVSSADVERACLGAVKECAAVGVPPADGGPERLVLYVVPLRETSPAKLKEALQQAIREELSPLFRVGEVRVVDALPRTASGKVMRRELRQQSSPRR